MSDPATLVRWLACWMLCWCWTTADAAPVAGDAAADWAATQAEIRQDPAAAEARLREALENAGAGVAPADRLVLEAKLLRAQFELNQDDATRLTRMLELGDELVLAGRSDWAMLAWREASRRYFFRGDYDSAQSSAQRVLDVARRIGNRKEEAQALNDLGVLAKRRGDISSATIHYENALTLRRSIDDRIGIAQTLGNLALVEKNRGALLKALAYQREAHALLVPAERPSLLANATDALGLIHLALDDAIEAERQFREAIRLGDLPKNQDQIVNSRINLCVALLRQGRVDEAAVIAEQARAHAEMRGLKPMITSAGLVLAEIARRRGALVEADRLLGEAMSLARALGDPKEIIEPLLERAELRLAQQRTGEARTDVDEALMLARRDQLLLLERQGLEIRSRVLRASGDADAAFQARLDYERASREIAGANMMRRMAELLDAERRRDMIQEKPVATVRARGVTGIPPVWIALGVLGLVAAWISARMLVRARS